jgi:hypothetical protein
MVQVTNDFIFSRSVLKTSASFYAKYVSKSRIYRGWGNGKSLTSVLGVISVPDFAIATVDTAPVATDS